MGVIGMNYSSSVFDRVCNCGDDIVEVTKVAGNPNPKNWVVKRSESFANGNLLIWMNYPDCSNYEGNKIMLYLNVKLEELLLQKVIDPHFSSNKDYYSPFARFEPTEKGWQSAKNFNLSVI